VGAERPLRTVEGDRGVEHGREALAHEQAAFLAADEDGDRTGFQRLRRCGAGRRLSAQRRGRPGQVLSDALVGDYKVGCGSPKLIPAIIVESDVA
jgi:hypothetical protein